MFGSRTNIISNFGKSIGHFRQSGEVKREISCIAFFLSIHHRFETIKMIPIKKAFAKFTMLNAFPNSSLLSDDKFFKEPELNY